MYKGIPVLVTGGCGFIGSHLSQALVNLGADVTILDSCITGSLDNIKDIMRDVTVIQRRSLTPMLV